MLTGVVAATVMTSCLSSPPASAELIHHRHLFVHRDPAGDVYEFQYDIEQQRPVERPTADITRVRARYGRHNLWLSMYFRRPPRPAPGGSVANFFITSSVERWDTSILTFRKDLRLDPDFYSRTRGPTGCKYHATVSYARARERMVIPAHCLDDARWVRIVFFASGLYPRHSWSTTDYGLERGWRPHQFKDASRHGSTAKHSR